MNNNFHGLKLLSVQLLATEMWMASQYGAMRQVENIKKKRKDVFGASVNEGWQINIEGALGECAVAKAFDLFWNGNIGNLKAPDVGKAQVRTTHHVRGRLILHKSPKDDPSDYFVLVTGLNGKYVIRGGLHGYKGMRAEFWQDPSGKGRPAYFVPQDLLDDIETTSQIMHQMKYNLEAVKGSV